LPCGHTFFFDYDEEFTDSESQSLKVSPNPSTRSINIEWFGVDDNSDIRFSVTDLNGRLVDAFSTSGVNGTNFYSMDVSQLPEAVYVIRAIIDDVLVQGRFVKE